MNRGQIHLRSNAEWYSISQAKTTLETCSSISRSIQMPKDQKRRSTRVGQHLSVVASTLASHTSSRGLSESFFGRVVDLFSAVNTNLRCFDNAADDCIAFPL